MQRAYRFLPFLGAILVLALSTGFALLPFSFGVQPSAVHAGSLASPTASYTGTVEVSGTVAFTDHTSISTTLSPITELQDGRILLVNGQQAGLYDPDTEVLSPTGNLNINHVGVQAITLPDGNALIVGASSCYWVEYGDMGHEYYHCDDDTAELYLAETGTFTPSNASIERVGGQTMTLLPNGEVLVAGGHWPCYIYMEMTGSSCYNFSGAGLYDYVTDSITATDSMQAARAWHTATLLPNGKVLVVGGMAGMSRDGTFFPQIAELYDPATGLFTSTGSLHHTRMNHTAILLPNAKVLIAGGTMGGYWGNDEGPKVAELYDPATGTFTAIGDAHDSHYFSASVLLPTGEVLLLASQGAELFDPATNTFRPARPYVVPRNYRWTTELDNGDILVLAQQDNALSTERVVIVPAATFTGVLNLPEGWVNSRAVEVSFSGTTSSETLEAGAVNRNAAATAWNWLPATEGEVVSTVYTFTQDGTLPLYLQLREQYGRAAIVVQGTVQIDTVRPNSTMQALPATISSAEIELDWSGSDDRSGLASYDVEVREGTGGEWMPLLSATTVTDTTFTGQHGITYYFRARARDVAGNVEAWPYDYDAYTLVDTVAPTGSLTINAGAHATTARQVTLYLPASDAHNSVNQMRLSTDGTSWGEWQGRATPFNYTLPQGDGPQTVYAQYRDAAGNSSAAVSDTIRLDEAAGSDELVTINNGALWTNSTSVTLTISAPARTSNMRLSNDGGFANAGWQLFESRPEWELIPYGSYAIPRTVYVRVRNMDGTESTVYSDEIIYDPVPPTGTLSIQSVTNNSVHVNLSAQDPDNLSGVAFMRVGLTPNLSQVAWQPYASSRTLPRNGTAPENVRAYAQFRDGAGNVSTVVCATADGTTCAGGQQTYLWLPFVQRR
jgi:hypothetical protein